MDRLPPLGAVARAVGHPQCVVGDQAVGGGPTAIGMKLPSPEYLDPRLTEQRNPRTQRIDVATTLEIVDLINAEDATVAPAVHAVREDIARAIDRRSEEHTSELQSRQ